MPELPEVETTRRGLAGEVTGRRIERLVVRNAALRWPVPKEMPKAIAGQQVRAIHRRAKYLLWELNAGAMLWHLGMSGSLRLTDAATLPDKHDHVDLVLDNGRAVRFTDPRRFGSLLWLTGDPGQHPLLRELGVEPLSAEFDGEWLYQATRGRRAPIKQFLMDAHQVVGIGNIYASEALFRAGIHPTTQAQRVGRARATQLVAAVKHTLNHALRAGGSSKRNYVSSNGEPGYFQTQHQVYDREGLPCRRCAKAIRAIRQGQRSTFYCPSCQR